MKENAHFFFVQKNRKKNIFYKKNYIEYSLN